MVPRSCAVQDFRFPISLHNTVRFWILCPFQQSVCPNYNRYRLDILQHKAYGLLERMETVELSVSEFSIKYIFFTPKTEIKLKTDENNYGIQRNPPKWPNLFYIPLSRGLDVILGFIRIRHIMLTKVQCCKGCNQKSRSYFVD